MNITTYNRRYDVSSDLIEKYRKEAFSLCSDDYYKLVWPAAEALCKTALDDGISWSKASDKLFNMTLTSISDSFNFRTSSYTGR